MDNTKRHQNFDYTMIADGLRTVSWSKNSHQTGVVKPGLKGSELPTHRNSSLIKQTRHDRIKNTDRFVSRWIHFKSDLTLNETNYYHMRNTLSLKFEANFYIGNINTHSIPHQLRYRLMTVNRSGNRQYPRNWCG